MAKGKKYRKWYEKHKEGIKSRQRENVKNMYALKMDKAKFYPKAKEEPPIEIVHPVHGYFMYECENCGAMYRMYLDKGLEDRVQDKIFPEQHKPVPFMIGCRNCGKGYCKHILWGIGDSEVYEELPDGASYFKNDLNEECGVAVVKEPCAKSREDYYFREIIGRHSGRFA